MLSDNGLKYIFLDWSTLNEFNPESAFSIRSADKVLRKLDFKVESFHAIHGTGFDLGETDPTLQKRAVALHKLAICTAANWGTHSVTFHLADSFSPQTLSASCRSIEALLPLAEQKGVKMALENMKHPYYGARTEEISYFLDKFSCDTLAVCYDVGHANIAGGSLPGSESIRRQDGNGTRP